MGLGEDCSKVCGAGTFSWCICHTQPRSCSDADLWRSHPGECSGQNLVLRSNESMWIVAVLLSAAHFSASSTVFKSSPSKLQITLFNSLNSARNNSRKCFGQWNVNLRKGPKVSAYNGISASLKCMDYLILFFLLKLDIHNPQCFSFQEFSGKNLLWYRQV